METTSHGTPVLQARRSLTNAGEYEALVISADTYVVMPTTMSRDDLISFLNRQTFVFPSREEFLCELERKGSTTAQVKVARKVGSD
jgi:hypothetical protein